MNVPFSYINISDLPSPSLCVHNRLPLSIYRMDIVLCLSVDVMSRLAHGVNNDVIDKVGD